MPRRIESDRRKTCVIYVRIAPSDYERLIRDAADAGLSVSEYVRRRSLGRPVIAAADAVLCRELMRLGGLLKHLYTESGRDVAFGLLSRPILAQIGRALERIAPGEYR